VKPWGGRKAQRLTRLTLQHKGDRCALTLDGCTWRATTAHHVIPRSLGGPDSLDNLVPACMHCNQAQGTSVASVGRPAERPSLAGFFSAPASTPEGLLPVSSPGPDESGPAGPSPAQTTPTGGQLPPPGAGKIGAVVDHGRVS